MGAGITSPSPLAIEMVFQSHIQEWYWATQLDKLKKRHSLKSEHSLGGRFGYFLFFLLGGGEGGVRGAGGVGGGDLV